jgi:MFS-type transporter involved in bile tolerance (Atg22 family)
MERYLGTDLRNSIYDGMFANMFASLTGGVFLTGFALYIGMDEFMIGLVASMPSLVTIFQLPASYLIGKKGRRKNISYVGAAIARLMWIPILIVAFLPLQSLSIKLSVILGLIFFSYTFASISYVSWLSWMSDLVPDEMRGRFFGTRNMLCGAAGMLVMVSFGKFLDSMNTHSYGGLPAGFCISFTSAVFFGIFSLRFLNRISEPRKAEGIINYIPFIEQICLPFKESNFRKFVIFAFLWGFSVNFASPFFTLYFLRDLKFNYSFVAALGMLSAFADLTGMQVWGRISDRVKNKAVIHVAGWVAVFLPLAWITVRPDSLVMPILLHLIGGGFWSGIQLCSNNLLIRISPKENRAWFLSVYNLVGGMGAASSPILAGFFLRSLSHLDFQLFSWNLKPIQAVFMISTFLRLLSLQFFRYVREPEAVTVGQMVRILRSIRGLNMAAGFNYLLHPFIETDTKRRKS